MIDRIVVENFKSLRRVDLALGRMNLLIGANASGKSNFLDALRVLQGIGHGFTIGEVLNGRPESATRETWKGIRGGSDHACFSGADGTDDVAIKVHGNWDSILALTFPDGWEYDVVFSANKQGRVVDEHINAGELNYRHGNFSASFHSDPSRPALGMLDELDRRKTTLGSLSAADIAYWLAELTLLFSNAQRVDPAPEVLRGYSQHKWARRMGDHGENFAAVVRRICEDERAKDAYLAWLRQLRPEEVEDVGTLSGAVGEPMFMLRENGREFPAPVLSDGTLRFAAITAAFFQHDMPGLMTIEEIEKGLHASRVQVLLELLRSQAETTKTQVVATTHSATVLDWLQEEDYKTTFLFRRDETTGESRVRSLADVPRFMDVVKKKPVSELFSEGWMEMVP